MNTWFVFHLPYACLRLYSRFRECCFNGSAFEKAKATLDVAKDTLLLMLIRMFLDPPNYHYFWLLFSNLYTDTV